MRIVVNDIAASTGGALSILKDFYHYIKENGTDDEWIFLLGDRYIEEAPHIHVMTFPQIKRSRIRKLGFDLITGRRFIKKLKPDAVLSMQNIITFGLRIPQVVYIHQPVPFQDVRNFRFLNKQERMMAVYQHWIGWLIKLSAKKASRVIVQTQWMKKAVAEKTGIPAGKIVSILPDIEDLSRYKKEGVLWNHQFFYPTSNVIYKNNSCIRAACEILGNRGYQDFTVILTVGGKEERERHIHFVGRLTREQVLQQYNESILIFPSYIETFGYPLAEARQIGTVIFASDCPFSREVLAGYENAYFFNPFHPEELANLMEQMLTGKIVRKETNGKEGCKVSNWETLVNLLKAGV